jgi:hypothetical protein
VSVGSSAERRGVAPVADAVLRVTGITTIHAGSAGHARTPRSFISQVAAMSGGVRLTALNPFVSERVDIVVQCTRTADRQAPRPRSQRSRTYWARRRHPIFAVIEVFRPPRSIAGGDRSPADAGRLDLGQRGAGRPPPSHLHERFTRSGHESNHCRRQALANVTETWRSSRTSTPGADLGDLSRRCLVPASAVSPASSRSTVVNVPMSASQPGLPPSFRHRRREIGPRARHPVRCRPQSTWWEGCRPVRDAEVDFDN